MTATGEHYRCFHCKAIFVGEVAALEHFGPSEHGRDAACVINAYHPLVKTLRGEILARDVKLSAVRVALKEFDFSHLPTRKMIWRIEQALETKPPHVGY